MNNLQSQLQVVAERGSQFDVGKSGRKFLGTNLVLGCLRVENLRTAEDCAGREHGGKLSIWWLCLLSEF